MDWKKDLSIFLSGLLLLCGSLWAQKDVDKNPVLEKAVEFAGMKAVDSIRQPRIVYSHTQFYQVMGNDEEGRIMMAVNPSNGEVVRLVKLCPYPGIFMEKATINVKSAEKICREFLRNRSLPNIPEGFVLQAVKEKEILGFKQFEVVFRRQVDGVPVMTDFISFLLGGTGEIISYSKVEHAIDVATKPRIQNKEAIRSAKEILGKGNLKDYSPSLKVLDTSLKIVYPNHFFDKWRWEWTERQALVWVVKFGDKEKPAIDVWIDAHSGMNQGGEIYERPVPDLFGIPNQESDITGIWQPALNMMQFNTGTVRTVIGDSTEAAVVNAISNGNIFILQTHGGTTATAESATIRHGGTFDQNTLEPDEVPANHLYYALLSCCESGHDGSGLDFKDTFLSKGAMCFQGYSPSINPDPYEESLVRYLAEGQSLFNANNLAIADTSPWFDIVIRWTAWCLNAIKLAPIRVNLTYPAHAFCTFTVSATIYNGEAALATTANNVKAFLKLPAGFTISAGPILQSTPAIAYAHSWTATWTVKAPFWTFGNRTFDVIVWSDNLGVAVHDFDDPFHKFAAHFSCPLIFPVFELSIAEIFRWWQWAGELYPDNPIPKDILKHQALLVEKFRSEYFFRKDPSTFFRTLAEIIKAENQFAKIAAGKENIDKAKVEEYLAAIRTMQQFLETKAQEKSLDVIRFYKEIGKLQAAVNEKATLAFAPNVPKK